MGRLGRWGDGGMGRWGDGEMGGWGDKGKDFTEDEAESIFTNISNHNCNNLKCLGS